MQFFTKTSKLPTDEELGLGWRLILPRNDW